MPEVLWWVWYLCWDEPNKVELANRFTRAVAVGNPREYTQTEKEEQEIANQIRQAKRAAADDADFLIDAPGAPPGTPSADTMAESSSSAVVQTDLSRLSSKQKLAHLAASSPELLG